MQGVRLWNPPACIVVTAGVSPVRVAVFTPALILAQVAAVAQSNAPDLVRRVVQTYSSLSKTTYAFDLTEVEETSGAFSHRMERRWRLTGNHAGMREEQSPGGVVTVLDGESAWTYNPQRSEYTKKATRSVQPVTLMHLQFPFVRPDTAKIVRQETVMSSEGPVPCTVVEVTAMQSTAAVEYSPMTYWIDERRAIVWKASSTRTSSLPAPQGRSVTKTTWVFTKAVIGGPVDTALLRFEPPPGAVQVDRLTFGAKSTLAGQPAPEFELTGPDGKPIRGASLRGRPVLLFFGRSDDDETLLLIEMMQRALKLSGLYVIFASEGGRLDRPLPAAYSFIHAIDHDRVAAKKFGIGYKGLVLIDRDGRVAYAEPQTRNALDLTRQLQAIGLW